MSLDPPDSDSDLFIWIFSVQTADKLNKDPISLYTQPLPVIDLCLQRAACSGLSPLSALQLTSVNKGIILVVQHPAPHSLSG